MTQVIFSDYDDIPCPEYFNNWFNYQARHIPKTIRNSYDSESTRYLKISRFLVSMLNNEGGRVTFGGKKTLWHKVKTVEFDSPESLLEFKLKWS